MSCRCSNCCPFQQANLEEVTELHPMESGTYSSCGSRGCATQRGPKELQETHSWPVLSHFIAWPSPPSERRLLLEATLCYQHMLREHMVTESPQSRSRMGPSIPDPDPNMLPSNIYWSAHYPKGFCTDGAPCTTRRNLIPRCTQPFLKRWISSKLISCSRLPQSCNPGGHRLLEVPQGWHTSGTQGDLLVLTERRLCAFLVLLRGTEGSIPCMGRTHPSVGISHRCWGPLGSPWGPQGPPFSKGNPGWGWVAEVT